MRLLDRHVLRETALSALLATLAFMFVLVAANVMKEVLGALSFGRIDAWQALELMLLLVPSLLPYALPMGLLTGVLMALGRMGSEGEITVMKAVGVSLARMALPVWLLAASLSGLCIWLQLEVGPAAEDAFQQVLVGSARQTPASLITPGKLNRQFKGLLLRTGSKEGETLRDFRLWQLDERGRIMQSLKAREARLTREPNLHGPAALRVDLVDAELIAGNSFTITAPESFSRAHDAVLRFPVETLPNEGGAYQKRLRMMTAGELWAAAETGSRLPPGASAAEREKDRTQLIVQFMFRLTSAVSVFTLAFLAVPLSIVVGRSETQFNVVMALGIALGYYVLTSMASWVTLPAAHPEILIWIPNVIVFGVGLGLFRRVSRY